MMTLNDLEKEGIPLIGFGPGIPAYKRRAQNNFINKGLNRLRGYIVGRRYINTVADALNVGFRLLDYSSSYGDGSFIYEAIKKSNVKRESIFITTRISNGAQRNHKVREQFMDFLANLKTDYVDLLQFHWPVTDCYLDTWQEMERLYEEGYVKHLGVANCHQHHLDDIFSICKYPPEVGQFEIHPLFTQKPLIQYYKKKGIVVEAYTPIARYDERLVRLPLLKDLEKKYNKSFVQIVLRWHIQNGVIPLIRSVSYDHLKENFDIFNFKLDSDDMKAIDGININSRLRYDPDNCDFTLL